ncbi:nuclear transport factor 2 family protein [Streptomyces sp. NPDC059446]|uniref:nuclear transport factor 2 family protein n=1 Tax=Streptomyces sp. NPDC059446 TaxID=3346833 RepID=UPI0036746202
MQAVADRVEIEALRAEVIDAVMMRDFDRFTSLFTPDGAMRSPHIGKEFVGREEIRAGIEWGQGLWDFSCRTSSPVRSGSTETPRTGACTSRSSGGCATAART